VNEGLGEAVDTGDSGVQDRKATSKCPRGREETVGGRAAS